MNRCTRTIPDYTEDAAEFLGKLELLELCDAWIYWMGFERIAQETNDLDGVAFGRTWLDFVDAEMTRRGGRR